MSALPNSQGPPSGEVPEISDQSFGKYHVFATLGRGGMAEVFLSVARGPSGFNKLVVLKRLRAQLADEPAFREMFLDEARLAARLNHPNIVDTFEVGEHQGNHYIAMEYLEGQALNKILRAAIKQRVTLAPNLCARIAADALAGLHYAHTLSDYDGSPLGIIHRDVSPHNLFVRYEGHVKLVDFGIAKAASGSTETEVGVLKGKVAYMAPEQAAGEGLDARADLFAMGVVLWEMLTLKRLFPGDNAAATLHKLMSEPIPTVASLVPTVPLELSNIVARALERDPTARFQSAEQMRSALETYIGHAGGARSDELGQLVSQLFSKVREDTQTKVRAYMAQFHKAQSTHEVRALTRESLRRVATNSPGLLTTSSGTGSQIAPVAGSMAPPRKTQGLLLPVVVGGCFLLGGISLLVFGLRRQVSAEAAARDEVVAASPATEANVVPPPSALTNPVAPPQPPPQATAEPSIDVHDLPPAVPDKAQPSRTGGSRSGKHGEKSTESTASNNTPSGSSSSNSEPGYLTLDTYPWTKVSTGGRSLGTTPLVRVALSPGTHTLKLENSEQGISQLLSVTIKSGETATKRIGIK